LVHSALVAGLAGGCVEMVVFICKTVKRLKGSQCLGVIGILALFTTGFSEHAGCIYIVVAHAHGCSIRDSFSANEGKAQGNTIFKWCEQNFNGHRWLPHHRHSCFIVVEFHWAGFSKGES
jgi:hypothetical protein